MKSNDGQARGPRRLRVQATDYRRPCSIHLYFGDDGPAEGCERQPLSTDAMEPLVCRHDGHPARRPDLQLPADVSQRRRRGGDRSGAGQRRVRGVAGAIFGKPLLGRRRRIEVHDIPVHRRALPLSREHSATSARIGSISLDWLAAMGCGADVWEEFQRRFHIPQILEFYAATEGNFSLYNCEGRVGAIGRIPSFLRHRSIDGAG